MPAEAYRCESWSNGLGSTREIARGHACSLPESAGNDAGVRIPAPWSWRLSIADIDRASSYSAFHGVRREQVLLSGNGLRLEFDDGELRELAPPHGRACFDGGRGVRAELPEGPVQVFNLMWRPDCVSAELLHRPLAGSMVFFVGPGVLWAVHLLAGRAGFGTASDLPPMRAGDTALLAGGAGGSRYMLEGGGEVLAIRITATDMPDVAGTAFQ